MVPFAVPHTEGGGATWARGKCDTKITQKNHKEPQKCKLHVKFLQQLGRNTFSVEEDEEVFNLLQEFFPFILCNILDNRLHFSTQKKHTTNKNQKENANFTKKMQFQQKKNPNFKEFDYTLIYIVGQIFGEHLYSEK